MSVDEAVDPEDGTPAEKPPRRRRWGRGLLLALFGVGVLVVVAVSVLLTTGPGQEVALDFALNQVRKSLVGSLTVDEIHSPSLLGGATLVGVHMSAEGDRPFLDADSVRVRYSLLQVFGTRTRVRSVTLFGPHFVISRYAGEADANVAHLIAAAPDSGQSSPGLPIVLGEVGIEGGVLDVLSPLDGPAPARIPTVEAPDGNGQLRRIQLADVSLTVADLTLRLGTDSLLTGGITRLSMDVSVLDRPLRVASAEGTLRFGTAGLSIDSAVVRLPGSDLEGSMFLGPEPGKDNWDFHLDLSARNPAALADLSWLDDRIPSGTWRGGLGVTAGEAVTVDFRGVDVQLEASTMSVDGRVEIADDVVLHGLEVRGNPLAVSRLEPWIGMELPLDGWLSGRASLTGPMTALATEGRVTLVSTGHPGGPTTADFRGTLRFGRDPGVQDFHVLANPINYATVGVLVPTAQLSGTGRIQIDASGRVEDGVRFVADVSHQTDETAASRVLARGLVRRDAGGRWITDVQGDLSPLSLALVARMAPSLKLQGGLTGSVRVVGPLDSLRITGEVRGGGGTAKIDAGINALDPGHDYRLDTDVEDVSLSALAHVLPDPSSWTGHLRVQGSGTSVDSLVAQLSVTAMDSRIGGLYVDSLRADMRAAGGLLTVDTVDAQLGGVHVSGGGGVGLGPRADGEAHFAFDTDNLHGLRPIFRGDVVTARDSLSNVDLEFLRMEGVDVDTLPTQAEVAMSGALHGEVTLTGSLDTLDVQGTARLQDGIYGMDRIGQAEIALDVRHALAGTRAGRVAGTFTDLQVAGRSFQKLTADLAVQGRGGDGTVVLTGEGNDRYEADGSFALDTLDGGEAHLTRATLAVDSLVWHLTQPTTVLWNPGRVTVHDLFLTREGGDPMTLTAEGTLARSGSSDFNVQARGVHLDRLADIAQLESFKVGGHLDLDLDVRGPASEPVVSASFNALDPQYGDLALDSISGRVGYENHVATLRFDASDGARHVFHAEGTVPIDLSLNTVARRVVDQPMDLRVSADSLDASVVLGSMDMFQDVTGVVSGDFRIAGTIDRPEPSGVLRLQDAAWSIEALGVRHAGVNGSLTLNTDRTVEVDLSSRHGGDGSASVTGTVTLEPLVDPRLDLSMTLQDFVTLNRRDIVGRLSGKLHLGQSYKTPLVEGELTVDQSVLFVEEFARSSEIVDLTDPRFGVVVDTAAFSGRPLLADLNNPFLQNLRADVNLSVPRDSWLRSADMNVEMGGSLHVSYDRSQRDVVMVGELQALRGSYTVLGKRFDVESGTVGFPGTPGINPTLNIQAVTKVRQVEGSTLAITATVSGTLAQPRVDLGTSEQGVAPSDLVSYLIFGRPSYQIATGSAGQSAAGSVVGAAAGGLASYVSGTLATQLGAALSQQIGLDYLSISQAGQYGVASGLLNGTLAGTQLELGQYIGQDVFVVLVFRVPSDQINSQTSYFGGARVEVAMTDDYNFQGFWEDRSLRSGTGGFGDLAQNAKVVGVFIFREWGY